MRILLLAHGVYPHFSAGTEIITYTMATHLRELGHAVAVAVPGRRNAEERPCGAMDLRLLEPVPSAFGEVSDPDAARMWRGVQDVCAAFQPDIVHVQHLINIGWQLLRGLDVRALPYALSLHDYWYLCPGIRRICNGSTFRCAKTCRRPNASSNELREWMWRLRRKRSLRRLLNQCRGPLLPVSRRVAALYAKDGIERRRMRTVYNGVDLPSPPVLPRPAPRHPLRVGYVGSVHPDKGLEVLLDAMVGVRGKAVLEIRGLCDPAYETTMTERCVTVGATMGGVLDHADLCNWLGTVDVLVVPSLCEETFGLVVQEGLQANVPVVASDIGGIPEQIVHGVNGFLFPPGDASALRELLNRFCDSPQKTIGGLDFTVGVRTGRTMTLEMVDVYRETISRWVKESRFGCRSLSQ